MTTPDPVETVLAWHAALNDADLERLVALSTHDVEVGGPRGSGRGAQLLRDWFGRAGVRIQPKTVYASGPRVVVDQQATWPGGEPQPVASAFTVDDAKVSSILRYETLDEALIAAGLDRSAQV